jgi:hypothetical protein
MRIKDRSAHDLRSIVARDHWESAERDDDGAVLISALAAAFFPGTPKFFGSLAGALFSGRAVTIAPTTRLAGDCRGT